MNNLRLSIGSACITSIGVAHHALAELPAGSSGKGAGDAACAALASLPERAASGRKKKEGRGAALLQKLARVYLRPEVKFPAMDLYPQGFVCRIRVRRYSGVGPWTSRAV